MLILLQNKNQPIFMNTKPTNLRCVTFVNYLPSHQEIFIFRSTYMYLKSSRRINFKIEILVRLHIQNKYNFRIMVLGRMQHTYKISFDLPYIYKYVCLLCTLYLYLYGIMHLYVFMKRRNIHMLNR